MLTTSLISISITIIVTLEIITIVVIYLCVGSYNVLHLHKDRILCTQYLHNCTLLYGTLMSCIGIE